MTIFERVGNKFIAGDRFGNFNAAAIADIDGDFAPEIISIGGSGPNIFDSGLVGSPTTDTGVPINGLIADGGGDADFLSGTGDNDSLKGGGGKDKLEGLAGSDLLIGVGGADSLIGGGGKDTLEGGGGRDVLAGGGGKDLLAGGGGRDLLNGGGGRDFLDGGSGKDTLVGGGGKDDINGGRSKDFLTGGGGRDTFHFQSGSGTNVIEDWRDGQDVIDINGAGFGDLTIIQHDVDVLIRFLNVQITVREADADLFTAADFIF